MIGKRRVLSLLNEFATFLTGIIILFSAFYFFLYAFSVDEGFYTFLIRLMKAFFYTEFALNLLVMLLSVLFLITDHSFEYGFFLKSILRTVIIAVIYLVIQMIEILVNRGASINL